MNGIIHMVCAYTDLHLNEDIILEGGVADILGCPWRAQLLQLTILKVLKRMLVTCLAS